DRRQTRRLERSRLFVSKSLFFPAGLEQPCDVAQGFFDLDEIGLNSQRKFVDRKQQFGILRGFAPGKSRAFLEPLARGFVGHEKQLLFSQKGQIMLGESGKKSITG
ncbi:MAG TPA: hypothetical protein VIV14_08915, partial [Gammaproteobacteria bacterium]